MADRTGIEWSDATWNPVRGCSRVSEGCRNCYAMGVAARFSGPGLPYEGFARQAPAGPRWTGRVELVPARLAQPAKWARPRRIFVNSMSDLFHKSVPFDEIDAVFGAMAIAHHHTFQVLTKRAARMAEYFDQPRSRGWLVEVQAAAYTACPELAAIRPFDMAAAEGLVARGWPLPNVQLGVSIEDQATANDRIPHLMRTPAALRFLSCEPLLGPVDITAIPRTREIGFMRPLDGRFNRLGWVIAGGESGPRARPAHPDWFRSLRDQCAGAEVPFLFKQHGHWIAEGQTPAEPPTPEDHLRRIWVRPDGTAGAFSASAAAVLPLGKRRSGRLLDGAEHLAFPAGRQGV